MAFNWTASAVVFALCGDKGIYTESSEDRLKKYFKSGFCCGSVCLNIALLKYCH